ncbi:SURF1 family cytochrome oxidase biogenesis protein [Paenarthrobacter ilicis]|uniref:SURF1-like protein n=1 Tax=Paenarthrobacter ilicis TaxID=43665 RepID=A0ABX0TGQ2_9MICC|nr:cytochrome oxidase assembly protein ShyY1 [Paenarthrobacter ilicis]NIJ00106.1 cytochrome oxidase assembly protein ShyY1 [Paenarthrobacter ilicis]
MLKTALKPRWIAGLVFALVLSAVFVLLSQWQLSRSTQHEPPEPTSVEEVKPLVGVLQPGQFFPGSVSDQMVSATGAYDPAKQVLVEGRLHNNQKGFWIVDAFAVDGAPTLTGAGASPQTYVPVARGWVADASQASPPPSGTITVTGRLIPSEAPVPNVDAGPGRASAVSSAELINTWGVSSYQGFIAATSEAAQGVAIPLPADVKPLNIAAQPPAEQVNWLNLFYAVEWVVFAGFSVFIWWRLVRDDHQRDLEDDEDFDDDDLEDNDGAIEPSAGGNPESVNPDPTGPEQEHKVQQ